MDLMYIIFMWLKKFIDRMGRIASFIGGSFLPGDEDDDVDDVVESDGFIKSLKK